MESLTFEFFFKKKDEEFERIISPTHFFEIFAKKNKKCTGI